ncbi:MAG: isochorismatase family protein [Deltaproteobacteria bacterium]|nr:isochorismatase family protein [Deltaproteobacteria bacterium]
MGLHPLASEASAALLVVDQQYDFEPGGALPVPNGHEIAAPIAELMNQFQTVVVTQDSHPKGHISFASSYKNKKPFDILKLADVEAKKIDSIFDREILVRYLKSVPEQQQVLWPDHCVVGTSGWKINSKLPIEKAQLILQKGKRVDCDSYSAFFENDGTSTGLANWFRAKNIQKILVVGLAGDFCVAWSAKDAEREGFEVVMDKNLTRFIYSSA